MEKGMEKGKKEEKLSMAINCLHFGLSLEDTSKLTGLSIDEIAKLK